MVNDNRTRRRNSISAEPRNYQAALPAPPPAAGEGAQSAGYRGNPAAGTFGVIRIAFL